MNKTIENRRRSEQLRKIVSIVLLLGAIALPMAAMASAGSGGGDELAEGYNWFKGIVTGYGGKLLALALLFVGGWAGLFKGSLAGAAVAIGGAMCLIWVPKVIETMFSATLPPAQVAMVVPHTPAADPRIAHLALPGAAVTRAAL
ncbi:MAG TPA: hypothetical protein PLN91_00650 [Rhodanobacteraceae bacterium]|nr:hypothetical protein [Rhodanobacteraceae bacterium]